MIIKSEILKKTYCSFKNNYLYC